MSAANNIIFKVILFIYITSYFAQILCDDNTLKNGENKPIIYKCCKMEEGLEINGNNVSCTDVFSGLINSTYVYDQNIYETTKSIEDVFQIKIFDNDLNNKEYHCESFHILESGELFVEIEYLHSFTRRIYIAKESYCFDYILDETFLETILTFVRTETIRNDNTKILFNSICFVISTIFLILFLAVYAMFPELRTLGGKVAMTCAACLVGAHSVQATLNLLLIYSSISVSFCIVLPTLTYFFFMGTAFWMNVMSYDLWWTFRGIVKARKINRRGETFKYCMYSVYGWGMTLGLTIFMVTMNEYPPAGAISPSIGQFSCYLGEYEQGIYLYVPMLILIICNCILYLMTVFNICRSNNSNHMLRSQSSAATKNSRNMFFVFLKISIIMGISFILEIVSFYFPNIEFWYITDAYNILIGVAFFVIFVCKRRVLRMLNKKFKGEHQNKFSLVNMSQTERK
ncbi:PREDICTED: G-protein coupled receptor Mth2-like [Papilio xuthus]|uniref:G-protein coupled receptor Mth2-like n=1 Tax=Papilio xuthus TaxID=66420 RepID=A0AAJ6ZD96_PAPXU|nr:PREDICTED: G-protein coupled receptor Mth2-like [Papilio xuthus]